MPKDISDSLLSSLVVIDENIKIEAVKQPGLFIEAVRYYVSKMRAHSQAEAVFEEFVARRGLFLRSQKRDSKERLTEGYFKARIQKHPKYKVLQQALFNAKSEEVFAKLLLEAYRMRRDAIKILADAANYEAGRSVMEIERGDVTRRLRNKARRVQEAKRGIFNDGNEDDTED